MGGTLGGPGRGDGRKRRLTGDRFAPLAAYWSVKTAI